MYTFFMILWFFKVIFSFWSIVYRHYEVIDSIFVGIILSVWRFLVKITAWCKGNLTLLRILHCIEVIFNYYNFEVILIVFVDIKLYLWRFSGDIKYLKVILILFDGKLGWYNSMSFFHFLVENIAFFGQFWGIDF